MFNDYLLNQKAAVLVIKYDKRKWWGYWGWQQDGEKRHKTIQLSKQWRDLHLKPGIQEAIKKDCTDNHCAYAVPDCLTVHIDTKQVVRLKYVPGRSMYERDEKEAMEEETTPVGTTRATRLASKLGTRKKVSAKMVRQAKKKAKTRKVIKEIPPTYISEYADKTEYSMSVEEAQQRFPADFLDAVKYRATKRKNMFFYHWAMPNPSLFVNPISTWTNPMVSLYFL